MVNVTDSNIELTGNVETGKERATAKRIAQSFAGNRKVVDKLNVLGKGGNPGANSGSSMSNSPSSNSSTGSSTQQGNTPEQNPKNQGDQSSTPK